MHFKRHEHGNTIVIASCDEGLLGKNLKDEKYDITISEKFYGTEKITDEELAALFLEADSLNLFGKGAISVAVKQGLLSETQVIRICGIEHAVILKV